MRKAKDNYERANALQSFGISYAYGDGTYAIDADNLSNISTTVNKIKKEFPEVGNVTVYGATEAMLRSLHGDKLNQAAAFADPAHNAIGYNKNFHNSGNTEYDVSNTAHEMGHLVYWAICKKTGNASDNWNNAAQGNEIMGGKKGQGWNGNTKAHQIVKRAIGTVRRTNPILSGKTDEEVIRYYLGNYATTNPSECISEGFGKHYGGTKNKFSSELVRLCKRELKK